MWKYLKTHNANFKYWILIILLHHERYLWDHGSLNNIYSIFLHKYNLTLMSYIYTKPNFQWRWYANCWCTDFIIRLVRSIFMNKIIFQYIPRILIESWKWSDNLWKRNFLRILSVVNYTTTNEYKLLYRVNHWKRNLRGIRFNKLILRKI